MKTVQKHKTSKHREPNQKYPLGTVNNIKYYLLGGVTRFNRRPTKTNHHGKQINQDKYQEDSKTMTRLILRVGWLRGAKPVLRDVDCKNSKFCYEPTGHIITRNLKIISDSRICSIISKGPKYRLPSQINFNKCREEIAVALNEFCNRRCRREHVECNALNSWKISIFNIIVKSISFYSKNLNLLPPKPKLTFRHLKQGIKQFHEKFVLTPADKANNNAIIV